VRRESLQIDALEKANKKLPASKQCRACKLAKPLDSFGRHRLAKDGHRHDCKLCVRTKGTKPRSSLIWDCDDAE
jgi:hypothetical protein